jgi:hypothetical protein
MKADHVRLRELAAWYREQAERAASPVIWDARLRTAEDLDAEADRVAEKLEPGYWSISNRTPRIAYPQGDREAAISDTNSG